MNATILVIAKEPVAGRVKTRLCPPCTADEAACLASAALADTCAAVAGTRAAGRAVALDGRPGPWIPPGFSVFEQVAGDRADRLAAATAAVGGPVLVVGMDTPQLTAAQLDGALATLDAAGTDAVLGPATDGGYWSIGLRAPVREVFAGVAMSRPDTGAQQLARLTALGLNTELLPELRDVDTIADAQVVAGDAPTTRFAAAFRALCGPGGRLAGSEVELAS